MTNGERYTLLTVLGRGGGGGVVYRARDNVLGREVAYKVLRGAFASERERVRFLAEAQITAGLEHPHIVPVHDLGETESGDLFYVMKLVEGGETLSDRVKAYHRSPGGDERAVYALLHAFRGALLAVAFAHDRGIVHRDLKPSNVMIGPWGEVVVVDWGLARPVGEGASAMNTARERFGEPLTEDGEVMGSYPYMALEQARGEVERIGPATDVYALGAILYSLLTGCPPRKGETTREVLASFQRRPTPPSKRKKGAFIPPGLDRLVMACLEAEPEMRPPDGTTVLSMFDSALTLDMHEGSSNSTGSREFTLEIPDDALRSGEMRSLTSRRGERPILESTFCGDDFDGLDDPLPV